MAQSWGAGGYNSIKSLNRFEQKIVVLSQMPKRLSLSPAQRAADKKARLADARRLAREDGWRLVDKTKECFYPASDDLPREDAFLRFRIIGSTHPTRFSVFHKIFTDEIMEKIKDSLAPSI